MACVLVTSIAPVSSASETLIIFAAASLKNALDAVGSAWMSETDKTVTMSYAASSALAKQVLQGAPADLFISADMDWMNKLVDAGSISASSVVKLLGNEIVLIAPSDSSLQVRIEPGFDLLGMLGDGRLAMADVKAVPAGKYGKAALESLGVWTGIESKIAMAENVRAALKLVATGEAPLGIVYATDALAEPGVRVIGTFPTASHPEIIYPAGLLASSSNENAKAFLAYLQGAKAQAIFKSQGFIVLAPVAN